MGDKVVNMIIVLFICCGFKVNLFVGVIEIDNFSVVFVQYVLKEMLLLGLLFVFDFVIDVLEKYLDKYDEYLLEFFFVKGYGVKVYEIEGMCIWLQKYFQ